MTLDSGRALEAALVTNRRCKIDDQIGSYVICSVAPDGTGGFTAAEDPVFRFSYKPKDSSTDPDTSTFFVGVRGTSEAVWTNGAFCTFTRDDSSNPTFTGSGTLTQDSDFIIGKDGTWHVSLRLINVEVEDDAAGVAFVVDLNGGGGVELQDLRWDLWDRIA